MIGRREFVNTAELAKIFGTTKQAIKRFAREGMPHYQIGRSYHYNVDEAASWIKKYKRIRPPYLE